MNSKLADRTAHTLLYFGFVVGVVAIFLSRFDAKRQLAIVLLLIGFYLIWGYSYHSARKDLSRRVIFEYLAISLISLLAAIVIFMS